MLNRTRQAGLSLVELMVGLLVSLAVIGGVGSMYLTTVRAQAYALRAAKLNQDLRATLNVIAADVRRAGYWGGVIDGTDPVSLSVDPGGAAGGQSYPYGRRGVSGTQTDLTILSNGACILYAYDLDADGSDPVPAGEIFGFRTNSSTVQMLDPGNTLTVTSDCSTGVWGAMTSSDTVVIDALTFSTAGSQCLNATQGLSWRVTASGSTQPACAAPASDVTMNAGTYAAPASGDLMTEIRQIVITLTGHHQSDAAMAATVTETVHVQNNRLFIVP